MIDVVMPVWSSDDQTIQVTRAAIDSIRAGAPDCRVILVDNGSTVGGGALREMADLYVRNKENLGYAKAVNQGLGLATKFVAVANNDIRVSPNWWEVSKEIHKLSWVGSVHFRMIPYEQEFNLGSNTWLEGKERWCSSSFFVMKNYQRYDSGFFNSLDDWDFWRRYREDGYLTAYTNKAEYQHLDSYTQEKISSRSENDKKNREYYFKKWGEYPEEWLERTYPEQLKEPWRPFP
jgi:GT2 family glycosyltransferase